MKNVPVKSVPELAMWHTDDAKNPPGAELIVHEVVALLNWPLRKRTNTVAPGDTLLTDGPPEVRLNTRKALPTTVKDTDAVSPLSPFTVMVFPPTVAPPPTLKLAVTLPPPTLQVGETSNEVSLAITWQLESVVRKPVPVIDMDVPAGPLDGLTIIVATNGLETVKTAWAESPPLLERVITYDPGATLEIVKDPEGVPVPLTRLHAPFWTPVPEIVQLLPAGRKPKPLTTIDVPGVPIDGIKVILAPDRTVRIAWPESPELPVTVTT
jgi:hypothetical protein